MMMAYNNNKQLFRARAYRVPKGVVYARNSGVVDWMGGGGMDDVEFA